MSYTVYKELRFTVCGEEFAISDRNVYDCVEYLHIKETRMNGQEDTHMSGELINKAGIWQWASKSDRKSFGEYGNDGVADAIPAYINTNPPPEQF